MLYDTMSVIIKFVIVNESVDYWMKDITNMTFVNKEMNNMILLDKGFGRRYNVYYEKASYFLKYSF